MLVMLVKNRRIWLKSPEFINFTHSEQHLNFRCICSSYKDNLFTMSAKLARKNKISQDDLRRLMSEHKSKLPEKKINNPLAKYNDAGQLTCILCQSIVRSENAWQIHVNAKQHKDNIVAAKKLKEQTNNFTVTVKNNPIKRPALPTVGVPQKKIKGILKNANPQPFSVPNDFFDLGKSVDKSSTSYSVTQNDEEIIRVPLKPEISETDVTVVETEEENSEISSAPDQPIPEGFFDDPILDAKVRNIEYKDPVEEEWERFQKEMREETSTSAAIIAGEQEEATADRQIDEIDEQIRNWSRVLDLELKKEETAKQKLEVHNMDADMNQSDSDSTSDIEEFLDWRSKKSFR